MRFSQRLIGLAVALTVVVGCSNSAPSSQEPTPSADPTSGQLGDTLSTSTWTVTVDKVEQTDGSSQAQRIADPETTFLVAAVKICTEGRYTRLGPAVVVFDTEDRAWAVWNLREPVTRRISAREPDMSDALAFNPVPAGQCRRGWLTFQVDRGTQPAVVRFTDTATGDTLDWLV